MPTSLDDARDKLRWAEQHLEALRREIEPFEEANPYRISVNIDDDAGEYVFYVHDLPDLSPDWSLRIGDCVHNARTALNYLMVQLVSGVTGDAPKDIDDFEFPVYDEPKRFNGAIGNLRQNLAFAGYLTRMEELQPFNHANPSIWGLDAHGLPNLSGLPIALKRLSDLDNMDKHRVLHAVWLGVSWARSPSPTFPPEFQNVSRSTSNHPLEDGAEVGRWKFQTPLPFGWKPNEMDMQRYFPLEVSFDEPLALNAVLEVLPFCLWGVGAILRLFEPVFVNGAPPLPVTDT
jgi:hypothetical protein